jgi:hypothetical protein
VSIGVLPRKFPKDKERLVKVCQASGGARPGSTLSTVDPGPVGDSN